MYSKCVERVMGIEPTLFAWEARVLPLNDARAASVYVRAAPQEIFKVMDG
jgi:hypothetical protein